ncbi:hypothetical protein LJR143_002179 [Pseudoxanthomonas sp. LjRoot143]|uniref:hypothetical protein n=1 Tax=Pseudoxanthomonas sp. LjRoot143 TaxID=3342266 RepID=UPI003ECFE237
MLVDVGAPPLPVVVPVSAVNASWFPRPYTPPPLPSPMDVAVQSVVDGAVISWTRAALQGVLTLVEIAPDVSGEPGAWTRAALTEESSHQLTLPAASRWVRLRTVLHGRTSAYTTPVLASRVVAPTQAEVQQAQDTADHADSLTQPGSGVQLGDQRNLMPVTVASTRSLWDGLTLSATFDTGSPATVTLSASAATLRVGSATVSYAASSTNVTQARDTTARYYGYYLDEAWQGGDRTLNVTTNVATLADTDGVVWVGEFVVVIGASGGGSGSGGVGGGGGRPPGTFEDLIQ